MDVTLKSPAKIGGKWHQAGETVTVSDEVAAQLGDGAEAVTGGVGEGTAAVTAGNTMPALGAPLVALAPAADWESLVKAEALKLAGAAFDGELGRIEAELQDIVAASGALEADKAKALARVAEVEVERDQLAERVRELEAQIAATAAPAATEPAEPSTSTPKRGGKAAKG